MGGMERVLTMDRHQLIFGGITMRHEGVRQNVLPKNANSLSLLCLVQNSMVLFPYQKCGNRPH